MNNLSRLPERAMQLASQVGDGLKDRVPDRALQWIETGAAIGALKSGTRVATRFVRRNPTVAIAAAAGAGLLWYAARRRAKQAERDEALEGSATRVDARRATKGNGGRRRTTTSARRGNASASDSTSAET
jgi:hypothetical protein